MSREKWWKLAETKDISLSWDTLIILPARSATLTDSDINWVKKHVPLKSSCSLSKWMALVAIWEKLGLLDN